MNEQIITDMAKKVDEMYVCLLGDPTKPDSEGLRGVVQRHGRTIGGLVRLGWLLVAAMVTVIVAAVGVKIWP